jgi:single-strand DNA-binding protein
MRLVDGEQRQQAALVQRIELGQHARRGDALGRGVEEDQPPGHHLALDPCRVFALEGRVEEGGVDPGLLEGADLVLHQRDQRADDDGHAAAAAVPDDRRHLEAEALAGPRRHQDQGIAAAGDVLDDVGLDAAERLVAEDLRQHGARRGVGGREVGRKGGWGGARVQAEDATRSPRRRTAAGRGGRTGEPQCGTRPARKAADNRGNPRTAIGVVPWHRSTRSSSSAISGATRRSATTRTGVAWCTVSIATSRNWKDKTSGEKVEETEWHRVVFNDKLAEIAGEYLKKGRSVYVEGRLKTRKWTDKDGAEKFSTEIIANEMQMLGGREGMGGGAGDEGGGGYERAAPRRGPAGRGGAPAGGEVQLGLQRHGRRHPVLIVARSGFSARSRHGSGRPRGP